MGDFYDSEAWRVGTGVGKAPRPPPIYGHKSPGMSHSQSEGNIDFRAPATNTRTLRAGTTFHSQHDHASELNGGTDVSPTFSRGRRITRTPSPVKLLEDIKEDQMVGSAPSPAKRSRSPMKQLFGENGWLGRSTSMNELPDEKYRKTGIKHWGGKIKERVENIVRVKDSLDHSTANAWTDGGCGEVQSQNIVPARIAIQVSCKIQISRVLKPSTASEAVLRNGAHDLRNSKPVSQCPAGRRPHDSREPHKSHPVLDH